MSREYADRSDDSNRGEQYRRTGEDDPSSDPTAGQPEVTQDRELNLDRNPNPNPNLNPDHAPITVCYVDEDRTFRDLVRSAFEDDDEFELRTEPSLEAATGHLDSVDCVVCGETTVTGGENGNENRLESLETIRQHDPTLPFVSFADELSDAVLARLCSTQWADFLPKGDDDTTMALLGCRIRAVVSDRRQSTLARRALVALETVQDGIAIVSPEGTFEVVDRVFAAAFGADREELLGRPWQTVYPADEVDRLRSTALPTVEDGWRWTGRCTGTRTDGTTVTAQTGIVGLEGGGLVFVLEAPSRSSGEGGDSGENEGSGEGGSRGEGENEGGGEGKGEHRDENSSPP